MRTIKKNILKSFLFVCLGLIISTVVFANVRKLLTAPEAPGRPSAFDIEIDRCQLRFEKSDGDGGSPITLYNVEYRSIGTGRWLFKGGVPPQFTTDGMIQCGIGGMTEGSQVAFRVDAQNMVGKSPSSVASDYITFKSPH